MGEVATSDFVLLFAEPRQRRGYVAVALSFGPPRRQG